MGNENIASNTTSSDISEGPSELSNTITKVPIKIILNNNNNNNFIMNNVISCGDDDDNYDDAGGDAELPLGSVVTNHHRYTTTTTTSSSNSVSNIRRSNAYDYNDNNHYYNNSNEDDDMDFDASLLLSLATAKIISPDIVMNKYILSCNMIVVGEVMMVMIPLPKYNKDNYWRLRNIDDSRSNPNSSSGSIAYNNWYVEFTMTTNETTIQPSSSLSSSSVDTTSTNTHSTAHTATTTNNENINQAVQKVCGGKVISLGSIVEECNDDSQILLSLSNNTTSGNISPVGVNINTDTTTTSTSGINGSGVYKSKLILNADGESSQLLWPGSSSDNNSISNNNDIHTTSEEVTLLKNILFSTFTFRIRNDDGLDFMCFHIISGINSIQLKSIEKQRH